MTILTSANGSLPLTLRKGETLVIRNYSGTETVTGSTVAREDASSTAGAGAIAYGPQTSAATLTLSSSGSLDYQVVAGDLTPAVPAFVTIPGRQVVTPSNEVVTGAANVSTYLPDGAPSLASFFGNVSSAVELARGGRHGILLCAGDSTTVGYPGNYTDTRKLSMPNVLARVLRGLGVTVNTCNFMGVGNVGNQTAAAAYDPRLTVGPFTTLALSTIGNNTFVQNTNNAGAMSFACDQPVDTAILYYLSDVGAGNGTMTLDIGGSALVTVDCNQAKAFRASAVTTLAAVPGYYTINIKRATNGPIYPVGLVAWNSKDPGISVINAGWAGGTIVNDTNAEPWSLMNAIATIAPDATILSHLINEWKAGMSLSTFTAQTAAFITAAKRGGLGDVALWTGPQGGASDTPLATQQQYFDAYAALVNSSNVPLFDCRAVLGPNAIGANYVDAIGHPTALGYARLGEALGRIITSAV